ncbi:MAG TPA: hypothetical protein VIO64_15755 [Pseudobacteroides sp.]|uniref:hypothetical protein n=1 Tax=Pseudobacteroides sp. TaxID=1968840 RepID=UPI002F947655
MMRQWKKRLPKFILTLILSVSLLTSCGKIQEQPYNNPLVESNPSPKSSSQPKVSSNELLYKTFEELVTTNDNYTLQIREKDRSKAYKASELLKHTVLDMLQKSEKLDASTAKYSGFNFNKYDYSLEFDGANHILLSVEDSTFYMKEDTNIYRLWGDSSGFWKNLLIDELQTSIDLPDKVQDSMRKAYSHDVDGDGTAEDVVLAFYKSPTKDSNGKLKLQVGLGEVTVETEIGWVTEPFHIMYDAPSVEFIPKDKGSVVFISYSWMTNGVGMTGECKAYEYKENKLREFKIDLPDMEFSYLKSGKVRVAFPQLNKQWTADPAGDIKSLEDESGFEISELLKGKMGFYPHIYRYIVNDFDGDGKKEICSHSLMRFQLPPNLNLGSLYTIYKYDTGRIVPKSVTLLPPYDEKNKMAIIKNELVENIFNLGFLDFERPEDKELWDSLETQNGKSDFETSVTELFEEGYIKKHNNRIFINSPAVISAIMID